VKAILAQMWSFFSNRKGEAAVGMPLLSDPNSHRHRDENMENEAITLTGNLTIQHVAEAKKILLSAMAGRKTFLLDLSQISSADIAGLQLLCALHKSLFALDIKLEIPGGIPSCLRQTIDSAGFSREDGCLSGSDRSCLWV
jgi:anti-anti-sigma regulatory factor